MKLTRKGKPVVEQVAEPAAAKPKKKHGCLITLGIVILIIILGVAIHSATSHPWDDVADDLTSNKISDEKADVIAPVLYDLGIRGGGINDAGKSDKDFYYVTSGENAYRLNIRTSGDKVKTVMSLADPASKTGHTLYKSGKVKEKATNYLVSSSDKVAIETALDLYAENAYSAGKIDHAYLSIFKNHEKFVASGILQGQNAFGAELRQGFTSNLTYSGKDDDSATVESFKTK